jgi:hypothetical protein
MDDRSSFSYKCGSAAGNKIMGGDSELGPEFCFETRNYFLAASGAIGLAKVLVGPRLPNGNNLAPSNRLSDWLQS